MQTLFMARAYVNECESRAQPLQFGCSARVTRCLGAHPPANGFRLVLTNACTVLVIDGDTCQSTRTSLGGSKLVQPKRFSAVFSNAKACAVHLAQVELCMIKVLCCSEPIKRNRLGVILRNASYTFLIQTAEHVLPVSAALP